MNALLGPNWITSLIGYVAGGLTIANEMVAAGGFPKGRDGWIHFIIGVAMALLGRAAKDGNKSNAPNPMVTPTTVP